MEKIIVVEAISSAAGYIKDIREAGYEAVALENYVSAENIENSRWIHDYYYNAFNIEKPQIITAKENYEETLEMVKKINPILIIPGGDEGVILASRLSEDLKLPCNPLKLVTELKNKFNQQERLKAAGLRYIRSKIIYTEEEALEFCKSNLLKRVVVKPVAGGATVGVFIVDNESDLKKAAEKDLSDKVSSSEGILIQEFIGGEEYIVDSLFCNGKHCHTIRNAYKKVFVKNAAYVYDTMTFLEPGIMKDLEDFAEKVCDAIGLKYGSVHNEFKIDDKGPVLIEVNMRVCGAMMSPDYLDSVLGYHETRLSLSSYLHPEETYKMVLGIKDIKKYGIVKFIYIPEKIYVKKQFFDEARKNLKTCAYWLNPGDEKYYEKTIDLATNAGIFYLVGDAKDVDNDNKYINDLEISHLNELFDYIIA